MRFLCDVGYEDFRKLLIDLGETPLPKYINREVEPEDKDRYQTIYAKNEGAVAAQPLDTLFKTSYEKT